jgi:hypothetical protein
MKSVSALIVAFAALAAAVPVVQDTTSMPSLAIFYMSLMLTLDFISRHQTQGWSECQLCRPDARCIYQLLGS